MSEDCAEAALLLTWPSWESWPWRHVSKRAEPTPSRLQYLGEQDLHIAGDVSESTGECEPGRAGPTAHLLCSGIEEEAMFSVSLLSHYL